MFSIFGLVVPGAPRVEMAISAGLYLDGQHILSLFGLINRYVFNIMGCSCIYAQIVIFYILLSHEHTLQISLSCPLLSCPRIPPIKLLSITVNHTIYPIV